mgnify:CR=1 FL=1
MHLFVVLLIRFFIITIVRQTKVRRASSVTEKSYWNDLLSKQKLSPTDESKTTTNAEATPDKGVKSRWSALRSLVQTAKKDQDEQKKKMVRSDMVVPHFLSGPTSHLVLNSQQAQRSKTEEDIRNAGECRA